MKWTKQRSRKTCHLLYAIVLLTLGCSGPPADVPVARTGESYRSFTSDGAWCWFSDPRAIYHEGTYKRTFAGWVDSVGNIVVGYYDHDSHEVNTHILHERLERDDHDNPSFFIDDAGKLMVFYSRHATGNSPIFLARAKKSEDIAAWEPVQTLRLNDTITYAALSNTYTYTNIVQLADEQNKMYLFWRGADFKPNFSVSADHGKTWEKGQILVEPERIYRDRRPYMKVASNDRDFIDFAFTDGHPRDEPTNSIYYARYKNGALYKASGEKIMDWSALPMNPAQADIVYDARETKEKAWIWDVAQDKQGNPVVVYARFPTDSTHVYYYGIYDGTGWNNYKLTDAGPWFPQTRASESQREPNYSGGVVLDHEDPSIVYLSREKDGVFEIEKWLTENKGKNWKVAEITKDSDHDNVRPFVIRNHPDDSLKVLWMNLDKYIHYTDYRAAIKMSIGGSGN